MGLLENKGKVMWQSGGIGLSSASVYFRIFSEYTDILSKSTSAQDDISVPLYWDVLGHPGLCTMVARARLSRMEKRPKIMQTSICRRVAFCTALLINRIMCFRMSHMASLCVCLVSCTYHWPIPVLRALHLAAYGLNLGYLLKPCVSY